MRARGSRGFSLIDLTAAVALLTIGTAVAMPRVLASVDEARAFGAARYMAGRLYEARMQAVSRSANVAWRFVPVDGSYTFEMYVDGNNNGVLTRDIERGVDRALAPPTRLPEQFPGVDFGTEPGLPPVDAGGTAPGDDPIRLGSGDILTFSAMGTSSSGSLYIKGRHDVQYVVRVLGITGKIRVLRFEPRTNQWSPR